MTQIDRHDVYLRAPAGRASQVDDLPLSLTPRPGHPAIRVGGSKPYWAAKRLFDITVALSLLPIVVAVGVVIWVLNPFFNPGPLLYSQLRTGRGLRKFRMWKFRSMSGQGDNARFATSEGARISRFAAFLRASHIDEMPQAWNVLIGDMSMVGPRPEQEHFTKEYLARIPAYRLRYLVRPGVSGLAQVEYGYTDNLKGTRHKLRYDLLYVKSASAKVDTAILYRTAKAVWRHLKSHI